MQMEASVRRRGYVETVSGRRIPMRKEDAWLAMNYSTTGTEVEIMLHAIMKLGKRLKEITVDCGVDILSFGGTKNGCMMAESVIAFRPELAANIKYLRKQSTQLYSKMRYVAAQFSAYLQDDLLYLHAAHANQMAKLLHRELLKLGFHFTQSPDANILLLKMEPQLAEQLLKKHFFYVWDENTHEIRLVTSWDTTEEDVMSFVQDVKVLI